MGRFLRFSFNLVALVCVLWAAAGAVSFVHAILHTDPSPIPDTQAIVVISGPGGGNDPIEGDTETRVARAVALWGEGHAPVLVVSGAAGKFKEGWVPDAVRMKAFAEAQGVPADRVIPEGQSYSTLQNAVYTAALPEIDPTQPILLVTSRYHLARSWTSFRWAGFTDISLVAATADAPDPLSVYTREGAAWLFNLGRGALASLALALGVSDARVIPWLE